MRLRLDLLATGAFLFLIGAANACSGGELCADPNADGCIGPPNCTPNSSVCTDNGILTCSASGYYDGTKTTMCPANTTCVANGGHAECIDRTRDGGTADAAHLHP